MKSQAPSSTPPKNRFHWPDWFRRIQTWLPTANPRIPLLIAVILAGGVFATLRLALLPSNLMFINDAGRDLLVLWRWLESGKPPLLGPQNSALPFNQSAVYFYLLMPAYWLTGGSYFSPVFTLLVFTLAIIAIATWVWRKQPQVLWGTAIVTWLMALHPQYVLQQRLVWNPSFVPPLIMVSLWSLWKLTQNARHTALTQLTRQEILWYTILGLSAGLAVGLTYSVVPLYLVVGLWMIGKWRWQVWKPVVALAAGGLFWQLPTVAFELRHNFFLTRALLTQPPAAQPGGEVSTKLLNVLQYGTGLMTAWQALFVLAALGALFAANWWLNRQPNESTASRQQPARFFNWIVLLLAGTVLLTLAMRVPIHAHYIFGITSLAFLAVASLRPRLGILTVMMLTLAWTQPSVLKKYMQPAARTVADLNACGQLVCQSITDPAFVSAKLGYLPFHNGPAWRYVFSKNGCTIRDIETHNGTAQTMLVVADQATYTHHQDDFHELTLFGASQEIAQLPCPSNVTVHILQKYVE